LSRRIGIFWKYFIAYSAMATVVIFILAAVMSAAIRSRHQELILDDLKKYAVLGAEAFRAAFYGGPAEADRMAKSLGNRTGARITLIATDGTVLGDSEKDPDLMENHSGRPEIKGALSGDVGTSIRYSTTVKEKMYYVAVPVIQDGDIKGVVRVSLKLQSIELLMREFTRRIALISVGIWIVALLLTFLFSSVFSSSVKHMVDLTKRFASGDFSKRAVVKRQDELGELAAGLNDMSQRLQSLFEQFQTQHDELNGIINSMTEGLLVLDHNLHVKLANNGLKQMFSIEGDAVGRGYMEVIRSVGLKEMIDHLLKSGEVRNKRLEFGDKVLLGNGITFTDERKGSSGSVLVFHDITSDAQLEKIKAEFAANASHELRTPLAAIKGYLETFEDEDPETQKSFIQIIRRNVDRISNLVSDLLLLSRLESHVPHISFEKVDLLGIASDVMKLVERLAKDKNIDLKMDVETDLLVNGDPFLLEQMFLNLLDNAVKYTEHGEVVFQANKDRERALIRVKDTGIGIPSQHLSKIFERFYRVDKTRSRDLGGTGLGLSIVKHIVQLHGGEIRVQSQPGRGTTFTVYLPTAS